jgi:hypothetical protein
VFNRGLVFIGLLLVSLLRGPASASEGSPGSAGEDPAPTDRYDYERYSRLAGPLTEAPPGKPYRVRFRRLDRAHPVRSSLLVFAARMFVGGFLVWLMLPTHWPTATEEGVVFAGSVVMTATTAIIGCLAFVNVATLCRATMLARDPVPVHPESGRRVAFITTIVPSAEPPELVRPTLEAALQIDYDGPLDVWLLDEGDDDAVKQMCAELGVHHFTRRGIERWNQRAGAFKAKTKARELQRLARRPRRSLRLLPRRRSGPRAGSELRRALPRLLP